MENRFFSTDEDAKLCGTPSCDGRRVSHERLTQYRIARDTPDQENIRILLVDDDPYYLDIIPAMLAQEQFLTVLTASTGFDAGIIVAEHSPQVVILDLHLADMDGRRVCERIKTHPSSANAHILGTSGFIDEEEIPGLFALGFDDFLRKPFQVEELRSRIIKMLPEPAFPAQKEQNDREVQESLE